MWTTTLGKCPFRRRFEVERNYLDPTSNPATISVGTMPEPPNLIGPSSDAGFGGNFTPAELGRINRQRPNGGVGSEQARRAGSFAEGACFKLPQIDGLPITFSLLQLRLNSLDVTSIAYNICVDGLVAHFWKSSPVGLGVAPLHSGNGTEMLIGMPGGPTNILGFLCLPLTDTGLLRARKSKLSQHVTHSVATLYTTTSPFLYF
ncbi:hypothetical protein C8R47DRAFT_1069893 [Mycena vitilis]|nr:hypothetical protein C8R47DRAFT_1069893 [Mycena vitilis]